MIKVKDGYAKLIGTTYLGSANRVLLSNGGDHVLGNASGNIPLNNSTVNTNLNADLLDGLHAGTSNGTVATYTVFPYISTLINEGFLESDYVDRGHPDELFLKALCKWAINKYSASDPITGSDKATLIGYIGPNSSGTCIIHLYRYQKDSTTLLPRYCRGLYQKLNGDLCLFGTSDYVWSYKNFAYTSEIPNVTNYYWANIPVSSASNTNTTPTFSKWTTSDLNLVSYTTGGRDLGMRVTGSVSSIGFIVGSSNTNRGIYDYTNSVWILLKDASNNILLPSGNVGIGTSSPSHKLHVSGNLAASLIYANRTGSSTDGGISLYSNSDPMTYGIAFRGTNTYGKHGYITSDWATYLTMNDQTGRGWIFRRGSTNVFSIESSGLAYADSRISANYYVSRVATGTQPYQCTSTTLNTNLNADLLDGHHASSFLLRLRRANLNISSSYSGMVPPDLLGFKNGYPIYTDPEFASGNNSIQVYNNSGGSAVTITREESSRSGNSSGYCLHIKSAASGASPNGGGWCFSTSGVQARVSVCIFRANIPVGYNVEWHSNSIGTGSSNGWLTSTDGTGKYEWYAHMVEWGSSPSSTFFFTLNKAATVDWYLSYANVIDISRASYDGLRTRYADSATNSTNATKSSCVGDGHLILYPQYNNEINFGGTNDSAKIYFGYRAADSRPIPTSFIFGGGDGIATLTGSGFIKKGSNNNYLLLGGGGHKLISDFASASSLGNYLPLTGGTVYGGGNTPLYIKCTTTNAWCGIGFLKSDGTAHGYIGALNDNPIYCNAAYNATYTIWHAGNDGSGSGLDADTTDGVHLEWSGSQAASDTKWLAGWTSDGTKLKAVKRADLSVNYATKSGVSDWLNGNSKLEYGASGLNYFNLNGTAKNDKSNCTPEAGYYHILRMNHANAGGYLADIAVPLNNVNGIYWRQIRNGNFHGWYKLIDDNNYSSILDSRYYTETEVNNKLAGYLPLAGGTMTGIINTCSSQGSWIGGKTEAAIKFNSLKAIDSNYFWRFYNMKSASGNVVCYGGLGDNIGFHGYYAATTGNYTDWRFTVNTANGNWTATGSIYAAHFYENSDIKLKTNIQEIINSDKMPIIKEFDWKEDNSHSYGLIAQELEEQGYSELVSVKDDGYKTVNYSAALSLIVGKLQVKIKELEKEIENLKNKN